MTHFARKGNNTVRASRFLMFFAHLALMTKEIKKTYDICSELEEPGTLWET